MLVEFSDFLKIPKMTYRLLGCLPFIEGTAYNKEQMFILSLSLLTYSVTILQEIVYMFNSVSSSFLETVNVAGTTAMGILGIIKTYNVCYNHHKLRSLLQGLKEIFPVSEKSQKKFRVEEFLKLNQRILNPYVCVVVAGISSYSIIPILVSIYEYYFKGMF